MDEFKTETAAPDEAAPNNNKAPQTVIIEKDANAQPLPTRLNIFAAIANGAGVGLLLGLLLGLAISPVVSGVIGTLSGLLAVLLGVNEQYITVLKGIRIGAFGFFCVAGILWGMFIRINNGLLPSRTKMMEDYTKVGFNENEARDFIAYREFNLVPAGWKSGASTVNTTTKSNNIKTGVAAEPADTASVAPLSKSNTTIQPVKQGEADKPRVFADAGNNTAQRMTSVLYSSEIDGADCVTLNNADESQPASEIRYTFEAAGGTWKELADNLGAGVPEKVYVKALLTVRNSFCAAAKGATIQMSNCAITSKLNNSDPLTKIKQTLSSSGPLWKSIVTNLSTAVPEENQKTLYLSLIKILCHD